MKIATCHILGMKFYISKRNITSFYDLDTKRQVYESCCEQNIVHPYGSESTHSQTSPSPVQPAPKYGRPKSPNQPVPWRLFVTIIQVLIRWICVDNN